MTKTGEKVAQLRGLGLVGRRRHARSPWQREIDAVQWYHEFDFGNGLKATPTIENLEGVRRLWTFIEQHLGDVCFAGKSVLDIGAWDGYWSFYAERRGAASVLATDDWGHSRGLLIARELLKSHIDVRQDLPVYELSSLNRRFDVVLCLGVFYHLRDPLLAFAQIRHICHAHTLVICEGELAWTGLGHNEVRYLYNPWLEFLPSPSTLETLLGSAYLRIESQQWLNAFPSPPSETGNIQSDRSFMICRPFTGVNDLYVYRPHCGLHVYDDRFVSR